MDIDEFLDRELSGLGTDSKKPLEMPWLHDSDTSPLFENISASLAKGNLDEAEQSYMQLWHVLFQQKLKWDNELYRQLYSLGRQFSGSLAQSYDDVKKKANQIYDMLGRARNSLKEGRKDAPFRMYSDIQEIFNSIPNTFFEEKKIVEEQVMNFYRELKNTTDNELVKRVSALVQEINRLIDKMNFSIRANDMANSIVSYNRCMELYSQVPEGFLRHRNSIGMRLLDAYKSLSIYNEISSLQRQLSQPLAQQEGKAAPKSLQAQPTQSKSMMLHARKERAKENMEKGLYSEASRDIQEALQIEPNDIEAKAIHAKIKTLQ